MCTKSPKNLKEFIDKYNKICDKGYIKTHRAGDTGIGKTLEDLLGIVENNDQSPDFDCYELKSHRINKDSDSMLTLLTKSPGKRGANTLIRDLYGYPDEEIPELKSLHTTLQFGRTVKPKGGAYELGLSIQDDKLYMTANDKLIDYAYWEKETIVKAIKKKYKINQVVFAEAECKGTGLNEEFRFVRATLASGIDGDKVFKLIKDGKIVVDLRLGSYKSGPNYGKVHDHGTAFRITSNNRQYLYENIKLLIDKYIDYVAEDIDK